MLLINSSWNTIPPKCFTLSFSCSCKWLNFTHLWLQRTCKCFEWDEFFFKGEMRVSCSIAWRGNSAAKEQLYLMEGQRLTEFHLGQHQKKLMCGNSGNVSQLKPGLLVLIGWLLITKFCSYRTSDCTSSGIFSRADLHAPKLLVKLWKYLLYLAKRKRDQNLISVGENRQIMSPG